MKFGYHAAMCNPEFYIPLAKAAESAGFDNFVIPDSICFPETPSKSTYPYNETGKGDFLDGVPFLEPFTLIPVLASHTSSLRFTTQVMKLPIRQPVLVAKQLSSVAVISNNRFTFGVGLSPWIEDFEVTQSQWSGRGKRMDEMIEIIRGLLKGDYFSYEGEFYKLPSIKICPVPSLKIPLLMGGHSEPALKRAARFLDGWTSAGLEIDETERIINRINELRSEYGTKDKEFYNLSMGPECYSLEGVSKLNSIGVNECAVGFRDSYAGGKDDRTLDGMLAEIDFYSRTVIKQY
ncbi:MAG: TIGR03619 family F420-dependent LLM class oxidoreductase [SAR86 cluster bacterium]|nr:TIGR03619 family F420-dependent LLM class oxidoreductase [SAR86 cluster bacterium]